MNCPTCGAPAYVHTTEAADRAELGHQTPLDALERGADKLEYGFCSGQPAPEIAEAVFRAMLGHTK